MRAINEELLQKLAAETEKDSTVPVLQAAAAHEDFKLLAYQPVKAASLSLPCSIEVKVRGITAQNQSGRCWEFSALNALREITAEKLNVEKFEFSQNYLSFYDKLEKCNNWLGLIIETAELPLDSMEVQYLMNGISDGNIWDQIVGLLTKYGAVPKEVMPETWSSDHTASFNRMLNAMLKEDAIALRNTEADKREEQREEMLSGIYRLECMLFGTPVKTFAYAWRDKDGAYHEEKNLTPGSFYDRYVGVDLNQYVHIINEPTEKEPMYRVIQSHDNNTMAENSRTRLNLPMEELEQLCIDMLKDGHPVWIGLDSGAWANRQDGIWDPDSFLMKDWLHTDLNISKGDRLTWKVSSPTHNVLLVGVNLDENGKPDRWKIENSWGEQNGKKGMFFCSERYFREYVFEAAVRKQYLNEKQKEALDKEPVVLKPWELEQF